MASKKKLQKQLDELKKSFTSFGMSGDPTTARLWGPMIASHTGVPVTPWTALGSPTVYACVRALSEDMARLPIQVQRKDSKGGWTTDETHPLNRLFLRPNKWQNRFDFIAFLSNCYAFRGNGFAVIIRDERGSPVSLVPVSPDRCQVMVSESGSIYYQVMHQLIDRSDSVVIPSDDMIHIRGFSIDGYSGLSPIQVFQESIGLSLAAQTHGAKTFANNASLSGVLESPERLGNEAAQRIAASWRDAHSGVQNAGKVAVLEEGLKFNAISMSNEDAQFLATREFQVIEICRQFRVPPHKVMALEDSHYDNVESMNQQYIDDALIPITMRLEQEMEYKLLMWNEQPTTRITFSFDEMLRADQDTRYKTYLTATQSGVLSINECRAMEHRTPVDGGDQHRTQMQNVPVSADPTSTLGALNANPSQPPDVQADDPKRRSAKKHRSDKEPAGPTGSD